MIFRFPFVSIIPRFNFACGLQVCSVSFLVDGCPLYISIIVSYVQLFYLLPEILSSPLSDCLALETLKQRLWSRIVPYPRVSSFVCKLKTSLFWSLVPFSRELRVLRRTTALVIGAWKQQLHPKYQLSTTTHGVTSQITEISKTNTTRPLELTNSQVIMRQWNEIRKWQF
jgi:hypothetical protein